jgi:hypothetical protein
LIDHRYLAAELLAFLIQESKVSQIGFSEQAQVAQEEFLMVQRIEILDRILLVERKMFQFEQG